MKLILNYLKPYRSRVTLGVIIKFGIGSSMEFGLYSRSCDSAKRSQENSLLGRCDVGSFRFFLMGEYRR